MALRIKQEKWILYRHTRDFELINAVAVNLRSFSKARISPEEKLKLLQKLKQLDLYKERNPEMPLDSINHRINTLAYYMFGYKDDKTFLFSPLGNLFLNHIGEREKISKIFLTMLWAIQFPHPHGGTSYSFEIFPFRLIFKLLQDERLEKKLYAFEVAYLVVFMNHIDDKVYEDLVSKILDLRNLENYEIADKFNDPDKQHVLVNAIYEWDYYVSKFLKAAGILDYHDGELICKLNHGNGNTKRKVTRSFVTLSPELDEYCSLLLEAYPFDESPLKLNDPERLTIEVVKEIYSFYPNELLKEIGVLENSLQLEILQLPKLIEQYSNNNQGDEAYLFEEVLTDAFNMFFNIEARHRGGAGNTDIECKYLQEFTNKKFSIDAKSTKNKLSGLSAGRLRAHRTKIGAQYTIVVTSRYVPAVLQDIQGESIVLITASTLAEFLYNCLNYNIREIDFKDFDDIITNNLGKDISPFISKLTIEKFGVGGV